jgi:nucleoside phosphorylase
MREEARHFALPQVRGGIAVTGIGSRNAEKSIRELLASAAKCEVITSGFAGGLNPEIKRGEVLWDADESFSLAGQLARGDGRRGSFHCSNRIAATAPEKTALRKQTGADAVEMESAIIRAVCREKGVPSATIRVISDAADENLPLDFNALMSADQSMNYWKLARSLIRNPGKIPKLIRLQQEINESSRRLAAFLEKLLREGR